MRGPRIRRILYATNEACALAALLAPLTSPAPHDVEVNRWCQRLARTRDWQRLRFSERGVHLANNAVVAWANAPPRDPQRSPGLATAARVGVLDGVEAAVEVLSERGLWPWAPGDTGAPWWWCDRCDGGRAASEAMARGVGRICGDCFNEATLDTPPSLSALVAVASLGAATLRRVAELVRELHAVTGGETGATLVWRVMTREALAAEIAALARKGNGFDSTSGIAEAFAVESVWNGTRDRWGEECWFSDETVKRVYPALRALADAGVHLVAADRERVVIAVEAL